MQDPNVTFSHLKRTKRLSTAILVVVFAGIALPMYTDPGTAAAHSNETAFVPSAASEDIPHAFIEKRISPDGSETQSDAGPVSSSDLPGLQTVSKIDETLPINLISYRAQPGDTLQSLASRFNVRPEEILPMKGDSIEIEHLIDPNSEVLIPRQLRDTGSSNILLPDSEIVYSPGSMDFDVSAFVNEYGGYLTKYKEFVDGTWMSGPEVVARAALDNSINPRLLLAILEYRSGWLTNPEVSKGKDRLFPIWHQDPRLQGLYLQLMWAADELSEAYYGWREGTFLHLSFPDGTQLDVAPELNAGTVAVQHLLSLFSSYTYWPDNLQDHPLLRIYESLFGDPMNFEFQLYDLATVQPEMTLPFPESNRWIFTGGPHGAWGSKSARAALDFAPEWDSLHRSSNKEILSVAEGVIARLDQGILVLDLDGDGHEQTGWSIQYLHVIASDSISLGERVTKGQLLGYASIEGGVAHGIHLHIARKFNGEWVLADGPLPFELGGWRVRAGDHSYEGMLYKDGSDLLSSFCASEDILLEIPLGDVLEPVNPHTLSGCSQSPEVDILRNNTNLD